MNRSNWSETLRRQLGRLGKFKYPLLVLLLGLALLAIPVRRDEAEAAPDPAAELAADPAAGDDAIRRLEQRLGDLLSQMEGAGRVEVALEYAAGPRTVYQTDTSQEVRTDAEGKETRVQVETVLTSGGSSQGAVAVQTMEPSFRGAVVAAQGADSAAVQLDLVNAVASLTGLGADDITVIKMK